MTGSARQYAIHRGVTHTAVNKAVKTGRIRQTIDGTINFEQADKAWAANTHPTQGKSPTAEAASASRAAASHRVSAVEQGARLESGAVDPTKPDFYEARARSEEFKAQLLELKLLVESGKLVELEPLQLYVAGMILKAREEFIRIAPELRDALSQEEDPIKCEDLVASRIKHALNAMTEYRVQ